MEPRKSLSRFQADLWTIRMPTPSRLHAERNEETGFDSDKIEFLGTIAPNPAIQSNHCHSYIARNAYKAMDLNPDEFEELRVRLVHAREIPALLRSGVINHALVTVAFAFLALEYPSETLPMLM